MDRAVQKVRQVHSSQSAVGSSSSCRVEIGQLPEGPEQGCCPWGPAECSVFVLDGQLARCSWMGKALPATRGWLYPAVDDESRGHLSIFPAVGVDKKTVGGSSKEALGAKHLQEERVRQRDRETES